MKIGNLLNFGSIVPAERQVADSAQKSSHYAQTLEMFDLCDPANKDLSQLSKVNTRVYNQRSVKYLQTAREQDQYPKSQSQHVNAIFWKLKDKARVNAEQEQKTAVARLAAREQRRGYRNKIRAIRLEAQRLEEEKVRVKTNATVKEGVKDTVTLEYEDPDQNEKYRQFLIQMELEE